MTDNSNLDIDDLIVLQALLNVHIRQTQKMMRLPDTSPIRREAYGRDVAHAERLLEKLRERAVELMTEEKVA